MTKDTGKKKPKHKFFLLPVSGIRLEAMSCFWHISLPDLWQIRRAVLGFSFHWEPFWGV